MKKFLLALSIVGVLSGCASQADVVADADNTADQAELTTNAQGASLRVGRYEVVLQVTSDGVQAAYFADGDWLMSSLVNNNRELLIATPSGTSSTTMTESELQGIAHGDMISVQAVAKRIDQHALDLDARMVDLINTTSDAYQHMEVPYCSGETLLEAAAVAFVYGVWAGVPLGPAAVAAGAGAAIGTVMACTLE